MSQRGRGGWASARHRSGVWVALVWAILMASVAPIAPAQTVNRCVIQGVITYQQDPCPGGAARERPTVQELNAAEPKRREAQASGSAARAPSPMTPAPAPYGAGGGAPGRGNPAPAPQADARPVVPAPYRCDGRRYCSQMRSCAEAKFFLANCPGVRMDGDGDGIPCEREWCGH